MMLDIARSVRAEFATKQPQEVLTQSTTAIIGVDVDASELLKKLGIHTVFDLACSRVFKTAWDAVIAAEDPDALWAKFGKQPADVLGSTSQDLALGVLPGSNVDVLADITPILRDDLKKVLDILTIRDLAYWPPYRSARMILNEAYGVDAVGDNEAPADLLPTTGNYPTERVQYSTVVLEKIVNDRSDGTSLATAGPVDIMGDRAISSKSIAKNKTAIGLEDRGWMMRPRDFGFKTPATGAILTFNQEWYSHGVTLGNLLHSIALGPGESTRTAVIDWSRRERAGIEEETTQTELMAASLQQNRALSEVTGATATEFQWGTSSTSQYGAAQNRGLAAGIAGFAGALFGGGLSAGMSSNQASALSVSASGGRRDLTASMSQRISDLTQQSASSARSRRASVIKEVSQKESETLSTRVLTNYNHMHAMTVNYYEVVQIYRVVTRLAKCERCLFIPMKPIDFNDERIINTYRRALVAAADSEYVRRLLLMVSGTARVEMALTRAHNFSPPAYEDAASGETSFSARNAAEIEASIQRQSAKRMLEEQINAASLQTGVPVGADPEKPLNLPIATELISVEWNENASKPSAVKKCSVHLESGAAIDLKTTGDDPKQVHSDFRNQPPALSQLSHLRLERDEALDDDAPYDVRLCFRYLNNRYFVLNFDCVFPKEQTKTTLLRCTSEAYTAELSAALNSNALHYSQAVWLSTDPQIMMALLANYRYPDSPTNHVRLAEYLDPRPIAVHGNMVGFRWHYSDREWEQWKDDKDDSGGSRIDFLRTVPEIVALPSGGTFAEAVLGRYNCAERLDLTRFWNWQESPIPVLPPEISPVAAASRASVDQTQTGKLEQPIVAFQTPQPLPDPQGLTAIISALTASNMFRDMSGLAETIGLAKAGLQTAGEGASAASAQAGLNMSRAIQGYIDYLKTVMPLVTSLVTGSPAGAVTSGRTNWSAAGAMLNEGRKLDSQLDGSSGLSGQGVAGGSSGGSGGGTGSPGTGGAPWIPATYAGDFYRNLAGLPTTLPGTSGTEALTLSSNESYATAAQNLVVAFKQAGTAYGDQMDANTGCRKSDFLTDDTESDCSKFVLKALLMADGVDPLPADWTTQGSMKVTALNDAPLRDVTSTVGMLGVAALSSTPIRGFVDAAGEMSMSPGDPAIGDLVFWQSHVAIVTGFDATTRKVSVSMMGRSGANSYTMELDEFLKESASEYKHPNSGSGYRLGSGALLGFWTPYPPRSTARTISLRVGI